MLSDKCKGHDVHQEMHPPTELLTLVFSAGRLVQHAVQHSAAITMHSSMCFVHSFVGRLKV